MKIFSLVQLVLSSGKMFHRANDLGKKEDWYAVVLAFGIMGVLIYCSAVIRDFS